MGGQQGRDFGNPDLAPTSCKKMLFFGLTSFSDLVDIFSTWT
jgi:hypothetical protein